MRTKLQALLLSLLATSILASASYAQDTADVATTESKIKYKLTTGADYSRGDYGDTQDTEVWYVPVTGKAQYENWTAKVTVPWLRIKGPGAIVGSGDGSVTQTGGAAVTTEEGMGDIVAALMYTFDFEKIATSLDVTGKVKLPTADEDKGLGTGETDYTLGAEITKTIDKANISAALSRKFVGSNATLNLHDVWIASVGAGYKLTPDLDVGVSYDWRQSASNGEQPRDATLYASYKLTPQVNLQVYGVTGFSDASADTGGGMMIGYKF